MGKVIKTNEVETAKLGHDLIIKEVPVSLYHALVNLSKTSDDFMTEPRVDLPPQEREG